MFEGRNREIHHGTLVTTSATLVIPSLCPICVVSRDPCHVILVTVFCTCHSAPHVLSYSVLTFQPPITKIMCPMGPEIWTAASLRTGGMDLLLDTALCSDTPFNYNQLLSGTRLQLIHYGTLLCYCCYCCCIIFMFY